MARLLGRLPPLPAPELLDFASSTNGFAAPGSCTPFRVTPSSPAQPQPKRGRVTRCPPCLLGPARCRDGPCLPGAPGRAALPQQPWAAPVTAPLPCCPLRPPARPRIRLLHRAVGPCRSARPSWPQPSPVPPHPTGTVTRCLPSPARAPVTGHRQKLSPSRGRATPWAGGGCALFVAGFSRLPSRDTNR